MATVYGESGAWADARTPLNRVGVFPDAPDELRKLIPLLEEDWFQSEPAALEVFSLTTQELSELVSVKRAGYCTALASLQTEHNRRMAELDQRLNWEGKKSTARRIQRWFLWGPLRLRRIYLQKRHTRGVRELERLPLEAEGLLKEHLNRREEVLESYRGPFREKVDVARERRYKNYSYGRYWFSNQRIERDRQQGINTGFKPESR